MRFLRVCVTLVSLCAVAVISLQAQDNSPNQTPTLQLPLSQNLAREI